MTGGGGANMTGRHFWCFYFLNQMKNQMYAYSNGSVNNFNFYRHFLYKIGGWGGGMANDPMTNLYLPKISGKYTNQSHHPFF